MGFQVSANESFAECIIFTVPIPIFCHGGRVTSNRKFLAVTQCISNSQGQTL